MNDKKKVIVGTIGHVHPSLSGKMGLVNALLSALDNEIEVQEHTDQEIFELKPFYSDETPVIPDFDDVPPEWELHKA